MRMSFQVDREIFPDIKFNPSLIESRLFDEILPEFPELSIQFTRSRRA